MFRYAARFFALLLLLPLLGLSGCASLLTRDLPLLQIAPSALGTPRTVQQQTRIAWPGGSAVMESVVQLDEQQLQVISGAMGVRMATLDYDGHTLNAQLLPDMKLPPQRILNDLLIVYAQADALRAALPLGWHVVDLPGQRRVLRGDEVIMDISYTPAADAKVADPWQGRAVLHHHQLYYTLTLDSSEVE